MRNSPAEAKREGTRTATHSPISLQINSLAVSP